MEINSSKTSSDALLSCGDERGFSEKLLLKPKPSGPQTERVPRSSVLDRLQSFLPQMAAANQKLQREMEAGSAEQFDIENVDEAPRVIEMDVALVELDGSDGGSEEETEDSGSGSGSESEDETEVTELNIKLPGPKRKAQIQVLQPTE
ncbi:uncharacterized protein C12orf45 homolog [Boleophthalmus pectinirostris]|uniref:uncharacterized protein C12orf45 homolog n=1 Tax=Boleophthalmus pectinirostris TaxID=150288 RepID=UPI000A1C3427|nr:uncharacterized protein C12orf45 homolog [Boleophthalmus pectinirostris]